MPQIGLILSRKNFQQSFILLQNEYLFDFSGFCKMDGRILTFLNNFANVLLLINLAARFFYAFLAKEENEKIKRIWKI